MDHIDSQPLGFDPHLRFAADLPATGAWSPGEPSGDRRFVTVTDGRPFALEGGGRIEEVVMSVTREKVLDLGAGKMGFSTTELGDIVAAAVAE